MDDDVAAIIIIIEPPRAAFMGENEPFCELLTSAKALGQYYVTQPSRSTETNAKLWALLSAMAGTTRSVLQAAIQSLEGHPA